MLVENNHTDSSDYYMDSANVKLNAVKDHHHLILNPWACLLVVSDPY